jgi:hypothetical protein
MKQDAKEEREFNTQFHDPMRAINRIADVSLKHSEGLACSRCNTATINRFPYNVNTS